VDLRSPSLPPISGIENGGRYNARALSPVLGDSPWTVRYSMTTDGSVPRDPDAKSPALTNATVFSGDDGALTTVRLKLLAVTPSGKRSGEKRELSFDIDLKSPEVPAITGVTDGGRYAQAVTVGVGQIPDDVQLFYSVSTGDAEPGDPQAGAALSSPLVFDVPEGMQRDFTLRVASRDAAGNRSLYDRRYRFTIDREPPDDPDASGAPPAGVSNRPVTLSLAARDAVVHYELTENGSIPRLPNEKSPTYGSPIVLNGRMGAAVTYRLLARSIDDLGNASRAAKTLTVLDRKSVV
jgi:hypothetical protein